MTHDLDAEIIQNRTADVTLTVKGPDGKPLANAPVTVAQKTQKFLFGCNIFPLNKYEEKSHNAAYGRYFKELLNFATLPFYWHGYEPERGKTNLKDRQTTARWCIRNGITTKGHPLVWHSAQPEWIRDLDLFEVESLQMERITRDVSAFKELVDIWDVVNEAADLPKITTVMNRLPGLCHQLGRIELIKRAFDRARAANRKAMLILNDFDISPLSEEIISRCLDAGVDFDVIGIQSHMHCGTWNTELTLDVLERFSRFGKPLHFTELTIISGEAKSLDDSDWITKRPNWVSTPEGEEAQAKLVPDFYRLLFAHPAVEAITWWDLCDRSSWMAAPSGLLRADLTPKPAYTELKRLIRDEWLTGKMKLKTDDKGRVRFSGFLGGYSVKAGKTRGEFELSKAGKATRTVQIA